MPKVSVKAPSSAAEEVRHRVRFTGFTRCDCHIEAAVTDSGVQLSVVRIDFICRTHFIGQTISPIKCPNLISLQDIERIIRRGIAKQVKEKEEFLGKVRQDVENLRDARQRYADLLAEDSEENV